MLSVVDGDTLKVEMAGDRVTLRLAGIDAPEGGQAFGREAAQALSDLVAQVNGRVWVDVRGEDRYGRLLAHAYLEPSGRGDGLGVLLVDGGFAWRWPESGSLRLFVLQMRARSDEKGLWGEDSPQPPWEWRREEREANR